MINTSDIAAKMKSRISEQTGVRITTLDCEKIFDSLLEDIIDFVASGERVRLGNLGIIKVEIQNSRRVSGNLPGTNSQGYKLPKRLHPYFVPAQQLKDAINLKQIDLLKDEE